MKVEELLRVSRVTVFSKSSCPTCAQAKRLLADLGVPAHVVELDLAADGKKLHQQLYLKTGHKTVPAVFVDGAFIGGNEKLQAMHRAGELIGLSEPA